MNRSRCFVWLIALVALVSFAHLSQGSPICCEGVKDPPLAQQFDDALIVLFGHFENPKLAPKGLEQGNTDFIIEQVYKDHDLVKGKKIINLPRYIRDSKTKFVIFCDVYKGKIDAYKGTELVDQIEMLKYLEKIKANKGKPQAERLRDAFEFLTSPETEVSMDAYREFARSDYRDYQEVAKKLPPDRIAGWLKDAKVPVYRIGLYAMLLGHCGNAKHGELLKEMINDPERRKGSGLHGLMMAYVMIEPDKGWSFIKSILYDKEHAFFVRFAALQTTRFLYDWRPDILNKDETIAKKEVTNGVLGVLNVSDMTDFAVEDLRKWKRWECCDQILGMFGQKNFNTPIIRKSILRFALQCPTDAARSFCVAQQKRDPEMYSDTKELLDLETTPATVTPGSR